MATAKEEEPTILRSFMDIPQGETTRRIVHAVNVGHRSGLHFTYDQDKGNLVQIWRGGFLNTAPMWHDRGDGSSVPMGSILYLSDSLTVLDPGSFSNLRPRGYFLDAHGSPVFRYEINGTAFTDKIEPSGDGKYIDRSINTQDARTFPLLLALAPEITKLDDTSFVVGDRAYIIKIKNGSADIIGTPGNMALKTSLSKSFSYQIIW
jgi:hypothetical protein